MQRPWPGAGRPGQQPIEPDQYRLRVNLRTPNRNLYQFTLNDFPGQTSVGPQASNIYAMDFDATATVLMS